MSLPVENICGLIGSLLLLYAPARDQILRHLKLLAQQRGQGAEATKKYWEIVASGYENERNASSFWDSATMAVGAILIAASFVINANS